MKTMLRENISKYNKRDVLVKMTKDRSPLSAWFIADKDEFLIHVVKFFTKSGTISNESLIIKTDMEQWIRSNEYEGFESAQDYKQTEQNNNRLDR